MTSFRISAFFYVCSLFIALSLPKVAGATPLLSMQAAEKCDTCHEMPDRSDPKWVEENYNIFERKCRLSCGVCHVNPSGGMLRNDAGFIYGTKSLPSKTYIPEDVEAGLKVIKENRFLTLGGDFRFLFLSREGSDTNPVLFPMQSDLYAAANLGNHIAFLTQIGLERGGNSAVREVFGMLKDFPFNSYLKVGKFVPPYGLRLDDHTAFIRTELGFDQSQSGAYVSGYEVGAEPVLVYGRFSQFNSDVTPAVGTTEKAARGVSGEVGWSGLWLHLGASYLHWDNLDNDSSKDRSAYGVSGAFRPKWIPYLDRLTYLFERDFRRDGVEDGGSNTNEDADITFNELDYRIAKGLNLKLRYETYEPDHISGENDQKRYVAGVDLYPYPFTEVNIQYRNKKEEHEDTIDELLVVTHIWF